MLVLAPAVMQMSMLGIMVSPSVIDTVAVELRLTNSSTVLTDAECHQIDAALEGASKALQGAQQSEG